MKNILETYLEKDGFYILAKHNPMDFILGELDYVISVKGEANFDIYFRSVEQINRFMKQLAVELERIDRLTVALVVDCLSICAAQIPEITTRERILNQLASHM